MRIITPFLILALASAFCITGQHPVADLLTGYTNIQININDQPPLPHTSYELAFLKSDLQDLTPSSSATWLLKRLLSFITSTPPSPNLTFGLNTFFTSLTSPTISSLSSSLPSICSDSDALEFRVDLLSSSSRFDLLLELQSLRVLSRFNSERSPVVKSEIGVMTDVMPIVYTVRTRNQAGTFMDDVKGVREMKELLVLGVRSGVEVLDVEAVWGEEFWGDVLDANSKSLILGSHHVPHKVITDEEAKNWAKVCEMEGRADAVKVILSCEEGGEGVDQALRCCEEQVKGRLPVVAMCLGEVGSYSRVLNKRMTPVTHPALPFVAAPGQLSAKEIMKKRVEIQPPRNYFILGRNIPYTLSPALHGRAISVTGLPDKYLKADVETLEEFVESDLFKGAAFGGTSVTIPYKQDIMKYLDEVKDEAMEIGAVNTVVVEEGGEGGQRRLVGYNTDWVGIFNPIQQRLGKGEDVGSEYYLVVGAGGAARAAAYVGKKLGFKLLFWNRTPGKLADLVESFGGEIVDSLEGISEEQREKLRVVYSSLPAGAEFVLPEELLKEDLIMFDANYKPFNTKFLEQGQKSGCVLIRGSEMFYEQGIRQFELWFGRRAPYGEMKKLVMDACVE
ncbi:hypothetical protein TrVE_jg1535 [Triparma verrucosa]|uniref:Shikimate dehydrogenase (NADP(+)) n=2 Tax=Triparma verrucosa TaxID=1606542 RepID=A0A9W7FPC5_9STRA|nr:hypothetical protein TrVE_jg1535 [Triparma verrucosa]